MTPTEIVLLVAGTLESLGVPYVLVGSLASSARGVPRATNDADLVVRLRQEHVAPLTEHLSAAFYLDVDAARRAVASGRSFNLIHLDTGFKIDLFVPPPGDSDCSRLPAASENARELATSTPNWRLPPPRTC